MHGEILSQKEIKEWLLAPEISVLRMLRQEDHQAFKTPLEGEASAVQDVTVREYGTTHFLPIGSPEKEVTQFQMPLCEGHGTPTHTRHKELADRPQHCWIPLSTWTQ